MKEVVKLCGVWFRIWWFGDYGFVEVDDDVGGRCGGLVGVFVLLLWVFGLVVFFGLCMRLVNIILEI